MDNRNVSSCTRSSFYHFVIIIVTTSRGLLWFGSAILDYAKEIKSKCSLEKSARVEWQRIHRAPRSTTGQRYVCPSLPWYIIRVSSR